MIIGISEEMDATFVLVALMMDWHVLDMLACYGRNECKSKSIPVPGNVNQAPFQQIYAVV